jgi:hypothetical protein
VATHCFRTLIAVASPNMGLHHMATILQFIEKAGLGGVFDDHATKVMGEAFDAACKDLHDTGQPSIVYEVVATRIIEAAKSGERDPEKLRDWALTAFGGKQG